MEVITLSFVRYRYIKKIQPGKVRFYALPRKMSFQINGLHIKVFVIIREIHKVLKTFAVIELLPLRHAELKRCFANPF